MVTSVVEDIASPIVKGGGGKRIFSVLFGTAAAAVALSGAIRDEPVGGRSFEPEPGTMGQAETRVGDGSCLPSLCCFGPKQAMYI